LAPLDHHYWRLFDLDSDHGLVGEFCVENIDYAVQSSYGGPFSLNLTADVYCLDDGLPFMVMFLGLAGTNTIPQPDAQLEFFNITLPPGTCCDTGSKSMAVALVTTECNAGQGCDGTWIGMNDLGQTGPTYYSTESCGLVDPTDLASLGFPDAHLIMVVHGDGVVGDDGGDPDVPATTGVGAVLLLLILLGGSAHYLRRRASP
jgi:hypothetical protein